MDAKQQYKHATRRRGVVLILVLAMLGLLALIGVTFATFSGQAQVAARYAADAVQALPPEQVFDFGLSALINDNDIPANAARGHSLKRDMYGNDATRNHHLTSALGRPLVVTASQATTDSDAPNGKVAYQVVTNIPTNSNPSIGQAPKLYGAFFNGCVLRLQQWICVDNAYLTPLRQVVHPARMSQTFEIVSDDTSGPWHVFTLTYADVSTTMINLDGSVDPANDPFSFAQPVPSTPSGNFLPVAAGEIAVNRFEIDGRFMRAFNGTGLNHPDLSTLDNHDQLRPYSAFPNFLYNKLLDPTNRIPSGYQDANSFTYQMDEDYDAPDNENMFMALKNADGSVVLPSFHRPGNIIYNPANATVENDWLALPHTGANQRANFARRAKFLRPRKADHPLSGNTFPDLIPDPITQQITYDVDNDGDGVTDSVWVDMGYPVQRDPNGKMYKPLFAFMVLGLNGRLPLNTAGNLHKRNFLDAANVPDTSAPPAVDHASHIGYSVNEINPKYALIPSQGDGPDDPGAAVASGKNYLQILLQGNPGDNAAVPPVPPVEGRFGEVEVIVGSGGTVFPRAGRSYNPSSWTGKIDGFDSNFDALDFVPKFDTMTGTNPETPIMGDATADLLDLTGRGVLPSERIRRFLTPIDLSGNGRIMKFDTVPLNEFDYGVGADDRGHVSYFLHYRPPGIPNWPSDRPLDPMDPDWPANGIGVLDVARNRVNVLHGYESFRNPDGSATVVTTTGRRVREMMALMPWEAPNSTDKGLVVPTFGPDINSREPAPVSVMPTDPETAGVFSGGNLALQDAAQMNLYEITPFDAPFGLAHQEYLNRMGDVDESGLDRRLERLLPDLFVSDARASVKRGLFSVESWDLGTWAAPAGTLGQFFGEPYINSIARNNVLQQMPSTGTMPSLMHGGKRINLNLPLPVSNDPIEPVRLKFCRDVYQMMKNVLYPPPYTPTNLAPTATQLAALGQFAVNIVDFRDPDGTMTRFENFDLVYKPPTIQTVATDPNNPTTTVPVIIEPEGVALAPVGTQNTTPVIQWGMEFNPIAITEVLGYQYVHKSAANVPEATTRLFVEMVNTLNQDFYESSNGTASDLDLRGWGFIITQDDPAKPQPGDTTTGRVERPNIVTGQLSADTIRNYFVPLIGTGMGATATLGVPTPAQRIRAVRGTTVDPYVVANTLTPATSEVIPNALVTELAAHPKLSTDLIRQMPLAAEANPLTAKSDFYWIHLLRPANPNFADADWNSADATNHNADKVVVDSFRFPFLVDNGSVDVSDPMKEVVTRGTNGIYSVYRRQPYRGAHFIPKADTFNPPFPYGYAEQTLPENTAEDFWGKYTATNSDYGADDNTAADERRITPRINHNLNTLPNADDWDHFPFHDRDFQSVAELMLVPACPPGLFTKMFAELPDPAPYGVDKTNAADPRTQGNLPPYESYPAFDYTTNPPPTAVAPPITPPAMRWYYPPPLGQTTQIGTDSDPNRIPSRSFGTSEPRASEYSFSGGVPNLPQPHPFPYLAESFFYSQASKNPIPTTPDVRGNDWRNRDWYKLMEFFEVPSTSMGYIGPVAAGQNADWARKDIRPGLLNLNLIVDEEVFYGLIDDPRVNRVPLIDPYAAPMKTPVASTVGEKTDAASNPGTGYNFTDLTLPIGSAGFPRMATAVNALGLPSFSVPVGPRGYSIINNYGTGPAPDNPAYSETMKQGFADFLKLRDGGSGVVFSPFSTSPYNAVWGAVPPTGQPRLALQSRPFRSLANQLIVGNLGENLDINDTVMRPARLPQFQLQSNDPMNPLNFDPSNRPTTFLTPRIPPRRLFQIPDGQVLAPPPAAPSLAGETNGIPFGDPNSDENNHVLLSNANANLFKDRLPASITTDNFYLGATPQPMASPPVVKDNRWHPLWRTEMLSKVMNQTTVRTHQYAVWVTVGFFEVTKAGNPQLANQQDPSTGLSLAVDQLGKEVGADTGKNVRYRSYYLIDRTKATGFDPYQPGDFRELITFRRSIE